MFGTFLRLIQIGNRDISSMYLLSGMIIVKLSEFILIPGKVIEVLGPSNLSVAMGTHRNENAYKTVHNSIFALAM